MEPVRALLDEAREVRLVGEGTDLTLSLEGRTSLVDDGHANMPGGEVYLSPVEDSAEGVVAFDVPTGHATGVRLRFRGGEVVEATAETGQDELDEALATDDGARRLGELGIGCNEGITDGLANVLFAEKMAGTVHLALGAGFPKVGGRNRSALHWDLVKDLRRRRRAVGRRRPQAEGRALAGTRRLSVSAAVGSETTIPAMIRTHPVHATAPSRSPASQKPKSAAQTGSSANASAVRAADRRRCAHVCTRNASAEAKTPVTISAPQTVQPRGTSSCPAATATTVKPAQAASISASVSATTSKRGATRSISTIWSE